MLSPAVSVIIPCYNAEKYLDMCIESLLNQTLQDIEIICVDDGSTDCTLDRLHTYAQRDNRVRVFSQQNKFAGAARNLGLSHARGEYLVFLDSDDFFEENLAQDAYAEAVLHNADVVLYNARCYDDTVNEFKKGWFLNIALVPEKQPFNMKDCPDRIYQISTPVPWTKMFRRQFLLDTKLQYQTLRHTNDIFFVFSAMAMAKKIVALDKILVNYRIGQNTNLQSTKNRDPLCFYAAYKAWHDKLQELGLLHTLHRSYANQAMNGCLYNLRSMNDLESQKIVFDKLREEIFDELDVLDGDVSFYFIEANYYEMRLVRNGTFAQYLAYQASAQIKNLWHCVERGIRSICSNDVGSKAYKDALSSATEQVIKILKEWTADNAGSNIMYAYQIVQDAFNRKEFSDVTIQEFKNATLYQEFATIQKHDYMTIRSIMDRRLIVSLTSYPGRIDMLAPVLDSLYNQDREADEIILWLASEEFPDGEQSLPRYLTELAERKKLTIRWCDNLKPHKKYFYAIQEYPEDIIVTVDDDLLYSKNMLSSLYRSYLLYPKAVSAVRVHLMLLSEENEILPYNTWIRETDCCLHFPSMQLFATGGAGTLYPPHLFRKEFFNREAINTNCPIADDLWLKAMEVISGVPVVAARPREPLKYLPGSQEDALKRVNDDRNLNDVQLAKIIRWTDEVFGKDSLVNILLDSRIFHPILGVETVAYHLDQERRFFRQQLTAALAREAGIENALLQTQDSLLQKGNKLKETEISLRENESKLREMNNRLKTVEAKLKTTESKLRKTQDELRHSEESNSIDRQMKELGIMLKGLRNSGHSLLSIGFKYLIYAIAWIPEKVLVFLMYYLRNGFLQTIKRIFRKPNCRK